MPKVKKAIVLASSLHTDNAIETDKKINPLCKPDIILDYNRDKCGVDVVDQMCAGYSVQRTTNRWPWVVMSNLLNIAGINAYVIYNSCHQSRKMTRYDFLQNMARALILPQIAKRSKVQQSPSKVRRRCMELIGKAVPEQPTLFGPLSHERPDQPQGKCQICREKNSKPKNTCNLCGKCKEYVCPEHFYKVCYKCIPK